MKEENELIKSMKNEVIDLAKDYAEIAVDSFLTDGILKEVPGVKTIVSVYNLGLSIANAKFYRNICVFLQELKRGNFSSKSQELFDRFKTDGEYQNKVMDAILIHNAKYDETIKSKILAKIVIGLAEGNIKEKDFEIICQILDYLNSNDFRVIDDIAVSSPTQYEQLRKKNDFPIEMQYGSLQKLIWIGILLDNQILNNSLSSIEKRTYFLTELGKKMHTYGLT